MVTVLIAVLGVLVCILWTAIKLENLAARVRILKIQVNDLEDTNRRFRMDLASIRNLNANDFSALLKLHKDLASVVDGLIPAKKVAKKGKK